MICFPNQQFTMCINSLLLFTSVDWPLLSLGLLNLNWQRKIECTKCLHSTRSKQRRCWRSGRWSLSTTTNISFRGCTRRARDSIPATSCRRSSGMLAVSWSRWTTRPLVSVRSSIRVYSSELGILVLLID